MDPMQAVQAAVDAGARTRKEITVTSGLDAGIVDVAVDLLVRAGALDVHALKFECGAGGCGNCAQDATCAPNPGNRPVPLRISDR